MLYRLIFRLIFARLDAELAHHIGMAGLRVAQAVGITKLAKLGSKSSGSHAVSAFGIEFDGPFGMAAGFDKNAVAVKALGDLGFSHVEIGTVTAIAQDGNPKPRLFRLIPDRALINRMGFNNQGAAVIAERLAKLRRSKSKLPIIGENAAADYQTSARLLAPHADYLAVNVSSPNTPGLRSLQSVEALEPILAAVIAEAGGKPVLVKIAPDLNNADVLAVADLCLKLGLAGIIATNTTLSREGLLEDAARVTEIGAGGLSGAPLKSRAIEVLEILAKRLNGRVAIISVGGVETATEVKQRLAAGASLVQGYTGFIYNGPLWARNSNRDL